MPWQKKSEGFETKFEKIEGELSEVFTAQYMNAVKSACQRYLRESAEDKPGVVEDGKTLLKIGEKARELRQMLKSNRTAIDRMQLHAQDMGEYKIALWLFDLQEGLGKLGSLCVSTPAAERVQSPHRGRPAGTKREPERALAFRLWEIFHQAHGRPAPRIVSMDGTEVGPLVEVVRILEPILGLPTGGFARYFREIGEQFSSNGQK